MKEITTPCEFYPGVKPSPDGYVRARFGGPKRLVHVVFYEERFGPVPEGKILDHVCRNRACKNPDHLEPVTYKENVNRSPIHCANKTHCKQGHEFTDENTYRYLSNGYSKRGCRICIKAAKDRFYGLL